MTLLDRSSAEFTGPAVVLDGSPLTPAMVEAVARRGARVEIAPAGRARLDAGRRALESLLADGKPHYGINTGFGSFARERIGDDKLRDLQRNLIRSHAAGVGEPLPGDVVRAMMLLLGASLTRGLSGVRPVVVDSVVAALNAGVFPLVPEVGSVGASGDLAPLAHVTLALMGEGPARAGEGQWAPAADVLRGTGLNPLALEAKEGLALINGTHLMAARAALIVRDAGRLLDAALVAGAMSIDACRATDAFLDPRVHEARRQPGPRAVAARVRSLLAGSTIVPSHRDNDPRVQDPYSLRCLPQVLGSAADALDYAAARFDDELGAVTDNPLVFSRGGETPGVDIVSAGNFHGMPLAIPLDLVTIALAHVAGISERRVYHMLSGFDKDAQLPPYLSPEPGLHSGLMIAQYTAAACCNELVGISTPASVANLPTSAGQEDYNSFGPRSAAKAARACELATNVVAIELLCASEGVERHRPLRSGHGVEHAIGRIRARVPRLIADRPPSPDIAAIAGLIRDGALSTPAP
jgi:histidine ammonia-lyase